MEGAAEEAVAEAEAEAVTEAVMVAIPHPLNSEHVIVAMFPQAREQVMLADHVKVRSSPHKRRRRIRTTPKVALVPVLSLPIRVRQGARGTLLPADCAGLSELPRLRR